MKKTFACLGCGRDVEQFCIKNHISNCQEYEEKANYLPRINKYRQQDDINELKFLSEQLALARDHIESLISKKNRKSLDQNQFDVFELPHNNHIQKEIQKQHKSEFFQLPDNKDPKRASFSFPQFNHKNSEPIIIKGKIQQMKPIIVGGTKMDEEKLIDFRGMKEEPKMGMKDEPKMGMKSEKKPMMMQEEEDQIVEFNDPQIVQCPLCKNKFYSSYNIDKLQMIEECWQMVCKKCLRIYIEDQFIASDGFPKCPHKNCSNKIPEHQSKAILGDRFEILQDKVFRKMTNMNLVQCTKCKSQYEFAPGNPNDAPKKDQSGKAIKSQHAILYAEQRFVCPKLSCKTQQCKQCKATPYHLGMDCKQFKSRALMLKCRYCNNPITDHNLNKNAPPSLSDICKDKDCQQLAKNACTKILPCSHPCLGVKNEIKCLPCLRQGCCEKEPSLGDQNSDSYCAICFVQGLGAAPSIQCGCGHIFHHKCLKKRFQIKWLTPRILFNFCVCPLCKKWIEVPPENELSETIIQLRKLHDTIEKMSRERLKFEECEKDDKLVNKDSPYFNKPSEYAMAIYAYFMCFKCKNPYFGGRKNCAQVMNNAQNVQGYDPKQLVCPKCCDIPIENCPKHGIDFIEFKCKFCCSTAQWFCWGNTHFCQPCHKRQCNGDYVSKLSKDQLPKCQGPGKCPTGGNHNGNGEQKMLGCAICRNYKQNSKNF